MSGTSRRRWTPSRSGSRARAATTSSRSPRRRRRTRTAAPTSSPRRCGRRPSPRSAAGVSPRRRRRATRRGSRQRREARRRPLPTRRSRTTPRDAPPLPRIRLRIFLTRRGARTSNLSLRRRSAASSGALISLARPARSRARSPAAWPPALWRRSAWSPAPRPGTTPARNSLRSSSRADTGFASSPRRWARSTSPFRPRRCCRCGSSSSLGASR